MSKEHPAPLTAALAFSEGTLGSENNVDMAEDDSGAAKKEGEQNDSIVPRTDALSEPDDVLHEEGSDVHAHSDDENDGKDGSSLVLSDRLFRGSLAWYDCITLRVQNLPQEIDATHSRIKSMRSLNLNRFEKLQA